MYKCTQCEKEFKNQGGLNLHGRKHSREAAKATETPQGDAPTVQSMNHPASASVTFYSPKAHAMTIVVVPSYWRSIHTPTGEHLIQSEAKMVEFFEGRFTTSDPEIINHLENIYPQQDGGRFPVLSDRQMRAFKESLN